MLRRFGPLFYLLGFWFFFRRLKMTDPSAERVRLAASRGPVVYILRTRSRADYLALNEVLRRRRLPLASFGNAVSTLPFMPLYEAARRYLQRGMATLRRGRLPEPIGSGFLTHLVASGSHAAIFLRHPSDWRDLIRRPDRPDPMAALLQAQALSPRPIQLLPVVVVWRRAPERALHETTRALLGTEGDPGNLGKLMGMAFGHRSAMVQIGEPVDLAEYSARFFEEPQRRQAKRLRLLMRRYCYREQQLVRGPRLKSPRWTRRLVLGSARVRALVDAQVEETGRRREVVRQQIEKTYDHMAARFTYPAVMVARHVARQLLDRIYSGVDIREDDVEAIRQAQREGTCVLVPSHKSHVDYLLLSTVLDARDLMIPHIVAGENLSFFPVGALFRRLGAFFIRRSFRDDPVFPTLFQSYLTHLFRDGYTVEFFIEGGRSRTGKLLPAKLGVLGYTVEAGLEARVGRSLDEVSWLPVAITYEQVAEEGPYARELAGEEKKAESLAEVVRAGGILSKRFGRVYVRCGPPVRLSALLESLDRPWEEMDRGHRREALHRLGEQIMHAIGQGMVVLPTGLVSMALLAQSEPSVDAGALAARVERFRALLERAGAEPSHSLAHPGAAAREALGRFLRNKLVEKVVDPLGETTSFKVVADRRVTLEYYKNTILHFAALPSLVAAQLRAAAAASRAPVALTAQDLLPDFRFQLFLLRFEFTFDPSLDESAHLERALDALAAYGAIRRGSEGAALVEDLPRLSEVAELTLNFLESYYAALRGLQVLQARDLDMKQLAGELQGVARQLLAVQDISRPEATSLANLKNAARAFREEQLFQLRSGGAGLEIDAVAQAEYLGRLRRLIGR